MKANSEKSKFAENPTIYDVIISGAGPVGLFLACELALADCSVLILEKSAASTSPLKKIPFGIRGLNAPSIEALDRRGLLGQLEVHKRIKNPHQNAQRGAQRLGGHFAGIPFRMDNVDTTQWSRLSGSTPTNLISEMEELETVLTDRAKELKVDIKQGHPVTDFHQSEDKVTVLSEGQYFTGKWLVGCDGSRSVVRKKTGIEFAGTEPEFTGYSVLADLIGSDELQPGRVMTSKGMYLQSQPGYIILQDFDGGAFHHSQKPITRQHVQEVLRRISNTHVTINTLHVATTWTDRARQATAYRDNRVFLAGDAAHIHAPLGGQGLNLGLGDAMNLGWKLALAIHNKASKKLLDSYFAERHPIGEQVLNWSRAQAAIMKPDPSARALNAILRDIIDSRDGATYFAGRVWGVSLHYDLEGEHPLIGYSVPNFEFEDNVTVSDFMQQGQWLLLDFDRNDSLRELSGKYGEQIKYVCGISKDRLGLSAILVRPDGIIAWASAGTPNTDDILKVANNWLVRQ